VAVLKMAMVGVVMKMEMEKAMEKAKATLSNH
jgi:hypothetical protein